MPVPIPGQFCMIKIDDTIDPLLGRPLCIVDFEDGRITFLIRIMGRGTELLSKLISGDTVSVLGPIGNGFPPFQKSLPPIVVVGGMGIAAMYMFIKKYGTPALYYGAKSANMLLLLEDVRKYCDTIYISTDDGTAGEKGSILDTLAQNIDNRLIYACGPEAMYKAMAERFGKKGLDIKISLEERMACGIGSCLGCVVKTGEHYQRVCKEGPVFDLKDIYN